MIFKDLLKDVTEEELSNILHDMFQIKKDNLPKYIDLYLKLKSIEKCEDICSTLHMEKIETDDNIMVWDINYSLNKRENHRYPIEFMDLDKIVNSSIIEYEVTNMGEVNYIAHLIIIILSNELESETEEVLYAQLKTRKEDIENGENKFLTVEAVLNSMGSEGFEAETDEDVY